MKINVIASTKPNYVMSKEEAILFSGQAAGICYMPETFKELQNEPKEKTLRRANSNILSGHHSVFAHPTYNLILENVPKILAMVLNNENMYNTSEKSARYTVMKPSEDEKLLYEKWTEIYKREIAIKYPHFDSKTISKLALENARYLLSIFTPATVMEYTVNFCQLNYIIHWAKDYIQNEPDYPFSIKLKEVFKEFVNSLKDWEVDNLDSSAKGRSLSLFAKRPRKDEFGENYCITYKSSLSAFAQAHRHRTLWYEMSFLPNVEFYVPPIIKGTKLEEQWLKDISSLKDNFPQGMLVMVNERGPIEKFVLMCKERLCGAAQLEIKNQTKYIMDTYLENIKDRPELYDYLKMYSKGARCTFPDFKCTHPCIFGPKDAMNRNI